MHVKSEQDSGVKQLYLEAMQLLQMAIELLDRANAPGHIAAHLDLAVHQLQDVIETEEPGGRCVQMDRKAAPQ
jgi:hypothetical protein